ncbi:molecular chaperone HtpG [Candidatus Cetobacterium colombiensis]|uniref:Chaperone protein HtpG n=1 Tax=Candidatus Cetobacterium colombiensis TaxID=3073100 RepID=A0ABU4WA30_9FUSO|nr:molecular chaperone HtpG [Candidatus Cetobacterium colombiensis]MDX8336388.1 molecular chaperone HtpG [Candidatus Cetobacterium colombiensis]
MKKETKIFQAETKELLNLMVHSIYTHKEIFLRELISNASDATDKLKFKALTDTHILDSSEELNITVIPNEETKTLTIIDKGIGMTFDEVVENIGTIAKSGSKAFLTSLEEAKKSGDLNIIGQFGVGFYSAFMVADKIVLETKSPYSDKGVKWTSTGEGSYEIEEIDRPERGTSITLYLKDNDEDKEFLNEYKIKGLVKKYSDYVKYPIILNNERINSTKPIWKTPKDELKDEDYNEFYKSTYHDWQDPLLHFNFNVQGSLEYNAILFVPQVPPYDLYTREYKRGLQLYTKNIFIMDKCEELIPQYFNFIKGLVDTDDLSLNISREILQKTHQLKSISKNLEKKIITEFEKLMVNDREKYIKFWEIFGKHIKFGVHENFGLNKEKLENLLLFKSSKDLNYTSLKEYIERMKEDQNEIFYAVGENIEILQKMPKVLNVLNKGFEVLYLTEGADEFALKTMNTFKEKSFKSVNEVSFETEEEKEEMKKLSEINKSLLEKIKDTLKDKIVDIKLNPELGNSSVSLSSKGEVSLEMEKLLSQIPGNEGVKAEKVLEINPNHPLFNKLQNASGEELKDLADILYNQGLLIEGFSLENPLDFVTKLNNILSK